MKKTLSILLVIATLMMMLVGCSPNSNSNVDTTDDPITNQTTNQTQSDETGPSETLTEPSDKPVEDSKKMSFDVVDIDMFGKINLQSNYIAAIAHNGKIESSNNDFAKKTYIGVYDIGQKLEETIMLSDEWTKIGTINNFLYNMGLSSDTSAFFCLINNTSWDDGSADFATIKEIGDQDIRLLNPGEYTILSKTEKGYANDWTVTTDNWKASWFDETTSYVNIKIGETDKYDAFVQVKMNNEFKQDDDTIDAINQAIANNEIKHSLIVLNDSDDINSIDKTYGQKHDLTNVSFLQDILAQKVSNMYGLALKDKHTQIHWDNTYLTYRKVIDGKTYEVTFDYFPGVKKYLDYELDYEIMVMDYCLEYEGESMGFEYTDNANNKYSYFVASNLIYIFKNEEIIGIANTNQADSVDCVGKLFGVHE